MKRVLGRIGFSFAAGFGRFVYAVEAPVAAFVFFRYRTSSHKSFQLVVWWASMRFWIWHIVLFPFRHSPGAKKNGPHLVFA
jgi:hypothetical protein